MDNAYIVCLLHFDTIGDCMEEGHGKEWHLREGAGEVDDGGAGYLGECFVMA